MPAEAPRCSPPARDAALCRTLRILGLVLAASAAFLLTRNFVLTSGSVWVIGGCAGLGVLALVASWWPAAPKPSRQHTARADRLVPGRPAARPADDRTPPGIRQPAYASLP